MAAAANGAPGDAGVIARRNNVEGPPADTIIKDVMLNGELTRVPLLNRGNVKADPCYWLYRPPSSLFSPEDRLAIVGGDTRCVTKYEMELNEWCESTQHLINDLRTILRWKYYKFWSCVIYDGDFHMALENYLRFGPRWFDPEFCVTPLMRSLQDKLHHLVILVFMRMSISRESKTDHISPSVFAEYLWEYIYDVARLVDICVLYGIEKESPVNPTIKKMITSVVTKQPALLQEYNVFSNAVLESMTALQERCQNKDPLFGSDSRPSMIAISKAFGNAYSLKGMDETAIFDICQAAVEIPTSVLQLLRHSPTEAIDFFEDVVLGIPQFFEAVFPAIDEEIERRKGCLLAGISDQLYKMLRVGQLTAVDLVRVFVRIKCLDPLSYEEPCEPNSAASTVLSALEKFCAVMMNAVQERSFIIAYNYLYPIKDDFYRFRNHQLAKNLVDESQFVYLAEAIQTAFTDVGLEEKNVLGEPESLDDYASCASAVNGNRGGRVVSEDDTARVKAVFPDLRDEFVRRCVAFYQGNIEDVVGALMDNNLHPDLEKWRLEDDSHAAAGTPSSSSVANSGDDFNNTGEKSGVSVHIGKKNLFGKAFLDDREAKRALRKVVIQYSETYDTVVCSSESASKLYDDEYDDTYDSLAVGPTERATEEPDRAFETPRVLCQRQERSRRPWERPTTDDNDSEGDTMPANGRGRPTPFCENPEEVRARYERRYQATCAHRRGGNRPLPHERDVVGAARGSGQSHDVLRNRQLKERHKGGNRRAQADWKRRQF